MWNVSDLTIKMAEGDWGVALPIAVTGTTFTAADELAFVIKTKMNGDEILTKTFGTITQNTISLELTEAESALLPVGGYVWRLDWYQDGAFLCNVVPNATFKVVDKA